MTSNPSVTHTSSEKDGPRDERVPYEPPKVESVQLTDEAAESLT